MHKPLLVAFLAATALLAGAAAAQSSPNTLARIKAAKAINVAYSTDSLPFSFTGSGSEAAGYSIDLCKRAIAQIGRAVGEPNLKVNWIAGSVTERLQMVATGTADLECANTTQTQSRLANVDFSNLIFIDGGGFLVKSGAPVNAIPDLAGKRVAVLKGTTTETRLNDTLRRRLVNATVVPITNANEGITMLEAGSVDAYAGDKIKLIGLRGAVEGPGQAGDAGGGTVVRALRLRLAAQRLGAAPRGQQGVDAGLHERRHRDDLRAVAGQARASERAARGHVPAELDSRMNTGLQTGDRR